jgi:glycine cleavage system regulatory protein
MKKHAILSAMGEDRVGVADELTAALAKRGIEIEESRWTALKGRFALIAEVRGEPVDVTSLDRDLAILGASLGFGLQMKSLETEPPKERGQQFWIESYSRGPSGVAAVTGVLKKHGVNIEDLETEASTSSWISAVTFQMKARITIPPSCPRARLREELRDLESDRNIDIVIKPCSSLAHEHDLSSI